MLPYDISLQESDDRFLNDTDDDCNTENSAAAPPAAPRRIRNLSLHLPRTCVRIERESLLLQQTCVLLPQTLSSPSTFISCLLSQLDAFTDL